MMLRRRALDVATDLPELIDVPYFVELTEEEKLSYQQLRAEAVEEGKIALSTLWKLQMFCTHPLLLTELLGRAWPIEHSSKYLRLLDILQEAFASSEKVLVFCAYTEMIRRTTSDIQMRFGVPALSLTGQTPASERQQLIDHFSAMPGSAALVLNPRAGGVGLNITAATHVVHLSAEWNPAVIDQATKRAHRRGQRHPVRVHRLHNAGTIDEVVAERVSRKRDLAAEVVVGNDGSADIEDVARALRFTP
jgi:SNF2 family DNA or RNA helicase